MNAATDARRRAAVSWSGGKDACLAALLARAQGWSVERYVTMCEPDGASKSHALPPAVLSAQVAALGGCWQPVFVAPGRYAEAFHDTLCRLHDQGFEAMVFGDIDLQAHRDWLEPACARAGLQAVFPLWGRPRAALAQEVIARGIRARLVCVDTGRLDGGFCGADYDAALLARLPAGVCPAGEDGEFHTLVVDALGFAAPLDLVCGAPRDVASAPPLRPTVLRLLPVALRAGRAAAPAPAREPRR